MEASAVLISKVNCIGSFSLFQRTAFCFLNGNDQILQTQPEETKQVSCKKSCIADASG